MLLEMIAKWQARKLLSDRKIPIEAAFSLLKALESGKFDGRKRGSSIFGCLGRAMGKRYQAVRIIAHCGWIPVSFTTTLNPLERWVRPIAQGQTPLTNSISRELAYLVNNAIMTRLEGDEEDPMFDHSDCEALLYLTDILERENAIEQIVAETPARKHTPV